MLDRDLAAAHEVLRRTTVLPDACSRVCDQAAQCEGACTWSLAGGTPVAIGKLERFVADHAPVPPPVRNSVGGAGLSVAVVGAGPAGIGAAWQLVEAGASVTVYEKEPEPGGLLGWGIPDFILPAAVAARPWQQLIAAGVDLRCGVPIRPEDLDRLRTEHDAVILAHGAPLAMRLSLPGVDLGGVVDATSFLKAGRAALENGDAAGLRESCGLPVPPDGKEAVPPRALVLGSGNTAMDVARTARRLGLRAVCLARRDERFARGRPDELAEARHEGVEVRFQRTLARLEGVNGRVRRAVLKRTWQSRAGQRPKLLSGDSETLGVDLVVMALGYRGDPAFATALPGTPLVGQAEGLADRRWLASGVLANPASAFAHHNPVGRLALAREVGLTASALPFQERLWAAGDALVGPSTVAEAMAQGRRAAAAVLAARRSRGSPREPRRALVTFESSAGRTVRAARLAANAGGPAVPSHWPSRSPGPGSPSSSRPARLSSAPGSTAYGERRGCPRVTAQSGSLVDQTRAIPHARPAPRVRTARRSGPAHPPAASTSQPPGPRWAPSSQLIQLTPHPRSRKLGPSVPAAAYPSLHTATIFSFP